MIVLTPFKHEDFERLIRWIDSKELLVTIAGEDWTYPLTNGQLETYLDEAKSHSFNLYDPAQNTVIGHAEILVVSVGTCKIDKLLIDPAQRGKGICQSAINCLLHYAFDNLAVHTVELNVFDWNIAAIRCYEKCGFEINPEKQSTFQMGDQQWVALNMRTGSGSRA